MPIIQYSTGDIFNQEDVSFIAHGVNCRGVMGAGFAKEIRARFPNVYEEYKSVCDYSKTLELLGSCFYVKVENSDNVIGIINMFTQLNYGRDRKYISYDAIADCFEELNKRSLYISDNLVRMPKIGAGLGGGNWNIIETIINEMTPNVKIVVHEKD